MKIAFDVAQTCGQRAGCPWYADSLARALASSGEVKMELFHHFGSWCNASTTSGTRIEGVASPLAELSEVQARHFWQRVSHEGLPGRPDIVHANCFDAPAIPGSKLVFTLYDLSFWLHPTFAQIATHIVCQRGVLDAMARADGLVFISEAGRSDFERIFPGWLDKTQRPTEVLHGASRFSAQARVPCAPVAPWLCLGSIEPRKNHVNLIDGYLAYRKQVPNPRPLLVVGAEGWSSARTHAKLEAARAAGVRHLGYVDEAELQRLYGGAFALIQPSWHEGFGLPVVEAMSMGLPVVCSNIPSLREVAREAGTFFEPSSPELLASVLRRLDTDSGLVRKMSLLSSARACDFSWEKTARRAIDFYHRILAGPS